MHQKNAFVFEGSKAIKLLCVLNFQFALQIYNQKINIHSNLLQSGFLVYVKILRPYAWI